MSALIGWALPYLIAAGAALVGIWRVWAAGKKAGRNQERAKNAKDRAENIDRIKRAAGAKPSLGVRDDPRNRDNG